MNCSDDDSKNPCCKKSSKKSLPFECKREIFGSNHLIRKRAKKFRCKSKRIRLLAQPKHSRTKFINEPVTPTTGKNIEILRPDVDTLPTRIKLLAFPKVRKLLATRDAYRGGNIDRTRVKRIENLASRSLLTMYSRLANVQIPDKRERKPKWKREDWAKHCEWLQRRACPKPLRLPPRIKRKNVPLKKLLNSIYQLSMPRYQCEKYLPPHGYESVVKESAKVYEPTERILKLSVPKKVHVGEDEEENENIDPYEVNPKALTYKPSSRIQQLAVPKQAGNKARNDAVDEEFDELPSGVLKRALKATLTPRTIELSKPRIAGGDDDEEKPNVNPKALKAKPTARILQLAKPREYPK